ncbi:hypothetical protein Fmac_024573 [Flemingia macrophylla]|uniref:Uncharacterized protein n=1 Tax=Flemingia macrophylla TaxID=520843 RepID=A0ABD1LPR7_9FABA
MSQENVQDPASSLKRDAIFFSIALSLSRCPSLCRVVPLSRVVSVVEDSKSLSLASSLGLRRRRLEQPSSGEGASSQKTSKRDKGGSSSKKGKMVQLVEEDSEDLSDDLEGDLSNINFDNSDGEKAEGYAPLTFNEEEDYIWEEMENYEEEDDEN